MSISTWLRDRAVRRVVKFGVPVAIGRLITSFTGVITTALLARYLGPGPFGVIAVIRMVATMVEQYANFNTWQAIIKYGSEAMAHGRTADVKRIIKLAFAIDIVTALLGGIVIVSLSFLIPGAFDWTDHEAKLGALYALTIATRVFGAPDGIFRICDAYRAQAIATIVSAVIMTGTVALAVVTNASFDLCVVALVAGEVIANVILVVVALWVARQKGYGGWSKVSLQGLQASFPGVGRFLLATNGQLTVRKTQADVDMLVVGSLLGKVPAGLFRVVKQLGTIPGRIFMPFEQVLFTELARATAAGDYAGFSRLLKRTTALATIGSLLVWAVIALFAEQVIGLVAGDEFLGAAASFRWYLLAMVLNVANTPIQRALVALGRPGTLFWFDLATLLFLIAAALIGANEWGLVGVSVAVLLHKIVQTVWSIWLVRRIVRARATVVTPSPST